MKSPCTSVEWNLCNKNLQIMRNTFKHYARSSQYLTLHIEVPIGLQQDAQLLLIDRATRKPGRNDLQMAQASGMGGSRISIRGGGTGRARGL